MQPVGFSDYSYNFYNNKRQIAQINNVNAIETENIISDETDFVAGKVAKPNIKKIAALSIDEQINKARDTIRKYPHERRKIYFFVGIADYKDYGFNDNCHPSHNNVNDLQYPVNDALGAGNCFAYQPQDIIFILTDDKATKANIERIFEFLMPQDFQCKENKKGKTILGNGEIVPNCKSSDYFYLFWSGHGFKDIKSGEEEKKEEEGKILKKSFLVPYDADLEDLKYKCNNNNLSKEQKENQEYAHKYRTFISMEYMSNVLCGIPAIKPTFLDTCFSARFFGKAALTATGIKSFSTGPLGNVKIEDIIKAFRNKFTKGYIQAAVEGKRKAFEFDEIQNGVLSSALQIGLGFGDTIGMADLNDNGVISENEMSYFLKKAIPRLMDIIILDRYLPKQFDGTGVLEIISSAYNSSEIEKARENAAGFNYLISSDNKDLKTIDALIISMSAEIGADEISLLLEGKGKTGSRIYDRLLKFYTIDQLKQAYEDAKVDEITLQRPEAFDCYPDYANGSRKDMVIKARPGLNQFEVQDLKDR